MNSTDVFVIGGGPAGLAAAIAARHRGFDVVVADGAEPPIDKACGEGLMPDGVAALRQLGVVLPAHEAHPFTGIRFLAGGLTADAPFPQAERGLAVRRTTLHRVMAEYAASLGVRFLWRAAVGGVSSGGVQIGSRTVRTQWIVGADGGNSRVRRWAGLDRFRRRKWRYAFRQHYRVPAWTERMEIYWGRSAQMYVAAVTENCVCVALASHNPKLRVQEALQQFPELQAHLADASVVSSEKGAITTTCTLKRVYRGNIALIGDASGTVDAITGEGLCLAFNQAAMLANCLESHDLKRYEQEHRKLALRPRFMARLMLTLDQRPRLQRRTLRVFRQRPQIFQRLLALHLGDLSPLHLAADGLTLGWGLLTA